MADENAMTEEESIEAFKGFVITSLNAGLSTEEMVDALLAEDPSLDREEMTEGIQAFVAVVIQETAGEQITGGKLIGAMIGGLLGALLSGWVWAKILEMTEYEVGYIAVGVGFLVGMGVAIFGGGARGLLIQLVGAAFAGIGIILGKYWGAEALTKQEIPFAKFWAHYTANMSPYDFLWFGLAFYLAYSMLKPSDLEQTD